MAGSYNKLDLNSKSRRVKRFRWERNFYSYTYFSLIIWFRSKDRLVWTCNCETKMSPRYQNFQFILNNRRYFVVRSSISNPVLRIKKSKEMHVYESKRSMNLELLFFDLNHHWFNDLGRKTRVQADSSSGNSCKNRTPPRVKGPRLIVLYLLHLLSRWRELRNDSTVWFSVIWTMKLQNEFHIHHQVLFHNFFWEQTKYICRFIDWSCRFGDFTTMKLGDPILISILSFSLSFCERKILNGRFIK